MTLTTLDYSWNPILIDGKNPYFFPQKISGFMRENYKIPAIYRWVVENNGSVDNYYIGESSLLCPRRIYGYLNPGSTQMTNLRMNEQFCKFVNSGKTIRLEFLQFTNFVMDDKIFDYSSLEKKFVRVFLEHLLLIEHDDSKIKLLNQ